MRIVTWNINGIRTIPQYHPWNTFKSHDDILKHLEGDIINFQEVKSTRTALTPGVALPPSYDAFYSFPLQKSGYSGVSTYTRRPAPSKLPSDDPESRGVIPLKAEEGLTGLLQQPHLKPSLSAEERISSPSAYAPADPDLDLPIDLKVLDSEGRVLTLDFGLFVLINVYCPNDSSTEDDTTRFDYKMAFHRLLEARIRALIADGREVIVLGDLNATAAVIDHCEGDIIVRRGQAEGYEGEEYFWEDFPARRWLKDLLHGEKKCMVDIVREFHPDRKGMFTCWNTKLSARASNYGTRIDYILITPGLVPWVKAADIEPGIKGSDHCPVWIELREEISVSKNGIEKVLNLRDMMSPMSFSGVDNNRERDPPRLATKFWAECSGKQKSLHSFFGAGAAKKKAPIVKPVDSCSGSATPDSTPSSSLSQIGTKRAMTPDSSTSAPASALSSPSFKRQKSSHVSQTPTASQSSNTSIPSTSDSSKQLKTASSSASLKTKGKTKEKEKSLKSGQSKLSSFFAASQSVPSAEGVKGKGKAKAKNDKENTKGKEKGKEAEKMLLVQSKSELGGTTLSDDVNVDLVDLTMIEDEDAEAKFGCEVDTPAETEVGAENGDASDEDEAYRLAVELSLSQSPSATSAATVRPSASQEAWKTLLKPPDPPRCTVHNEVAREYRVNKPGVNKGRSFWVCARPVGPGYDAGRSRRPRDEVDPRWKCNFFVWSSDAKRGKGSSSSGKSDVR